MKKIIKKAFKEMGFKVARVEKEKSKNMREVAFNQYEALMLGALSTLGNLRIVQIGANDGVINDPIYNFVMKYKQFTKVLLIEPQTEVIPYLKQNYSEHANKVIFNSAIGSQDELILFGIKNSYRGYFTASYAKGWPEYRAATGITSSNKEHVLTWANKWKTEELLNIEDAIETTKVPCMKLKPLLEKVEFGKRVDVLQVDTEGTDDDAIYNSSIDIYKPYIIRYEVKNLTVRNEEKLKAFLNTHGYATYNISSGDTIAVYLPSN